MKLFARWIQLLFAAPILILSMVTFPVSGQPVILSCPDMNGRGQLSNPERKHLNSDGKKVIVFVEFLIADVAIVLCV